MMDICGEVEKLENTIKDYVEEDIKKKEILNILEKFLSDLKAGTGYFCQAILVYG